MCSFHPHFLALPPPRKAHSCSTAGQMASSVMNFLGEHIVKVCIIINKYKGLLSIHKKTQKSHILSLSTTLKQMSIGYECRLKDTSFAVASGDRVLNRACPLSSQMRAESLRDTKPNPWCSYPVMNTEENKVTAEYLRLLF